MTEQITLVAPRVRGSVLRVAGSTEDYACDQCSEAVLLSPNSQEVITWGLVSAIWCVPCALFTVQKMTEEVGAGEEPAT